MRSYLIGALLSLAASLHLVGCGGGSASPGVIPEAQAAVVVDTCPAGDEAAQTAQLQSILDTAKEVVLPACTFNVSTLRAWRPVSIRGAGAQVDGTVIRYSSAEGVVVDPNVVVSIAAGGGAEKGWNKRGYWFSMTGVRIEPSVRGGGKHPFVMRVRPGFFISTSYVAHNHFGGSGAQGIYLDNTANLQDGIFTTTFEHNFIENGVLGVNIGDSVHFIDNVVPDGALKVGTPGYDLSWVAGAAESEITRGNITTSAGCILIRSAQGLTLNHVWCESPGAPPGEQGAITLKNCLECTVRDSRIQTFGTAPYALALDRTETTEIASNKFNKGTQGHILVTGRDNKLTGLNRFDGGLTGILTGASTGLVATP